MKSAILFLFFFVLLLASCIDKCKDPVVSCQMIGNDTLFVCDASSIKDHKKMKLSDWVTDFKIIRFENADTALFKSWKVYITDHYVGILQSAILPFKLFDHQGRFLGDIGHIGQGPGEYTMLYSAAISEKKNTIYLAPFNGKSLLKYDLNGNFVTSVEIGTMQKPQIRFEQDGSITLTHLCFRGVTSYQYACIDEIGNVHYVQPVRHLAIEPRDKEGNFCGYNHEIWFYNNVADFTYMTTASDTLYRFDLKEERTNPRFTLINHSDAYCIYNELPSCFLINIFSSKEENMAIESGYVVVDKLSGQAHYLKLTNDWVGHLPVSGFAQSSNGWYYEMFEPYKLVEMIDKRLSEKNCSIEDQKVLKELRESVDEDGNNILFMGKLKDSLLNYHGS